MNISRLFSAVLSCLALALPAAAQDADLPAIIDYIAAAGALTATLDCARLHQRHSAAALDGLGEYAQHEKLAQLAALAVNRDH